MPVSISNQAKLVAFVNYRRLEIKRKGSLESIPQIKFPETSYISSPELKILDNISSTELEILSTIDPHNWNSQYLFIPRIVILKNFYPSPGLEFWRTLFHHQNWHSEETFSIPRIGILKKLCPSPELGSFRTFFHPQIWNYWELLIPRIGILKNFFPSPELGSFKPFHPQNWEAVFDRLLLPYSSFLFLFLFFFLFVFFFTWASLFIVAFLGPTTT